MADKIQNAYKTSKNILAKKGWFSPPFQTEKELRDILQNYIKKRISMLTVLWYISVV